MIFALGMHSYAHAEDGNGSDDNDSGSQISSSHSEESEQGDDDDGDDDNGNWATSTNGSPRPFLFKGEGRGDMKPPRGLGVRPQDTASTTVDGIKGFGNLNDEGEDRGPRPELKMKLWKNDADFMKKRNELEKKFEQHNQEIQDKKEKLKEEFKNKLGEIRGNIMLRYTIAITRIAEIQTRLQSRIDALKANGNDTTAAQAKIDSSKVHLTTARSEGDQAKALVEGDAPDTHKDEIKTHLSNAKAELKLAFTDIRDAFKLIKPLAEQEDEHADEAENGTTTTTPSTATTTQ